MCYVIKETEKKFRGTPNFPLELCFLACSDNVDFFSKEIYSEKLKLLEA